jgi:hypothetical protein
MIFQILPNRIAWRLLSFSISVASILISSQAPGQVPGGTLSGTVADASGAVIPKASASITNVATGLVRDIAADGAGFYTAPHLLPGTVKRISETFSVQFRAEFFNILNRANFAVPIAPDNADIFDPTGAPTGAAGLLTSTTITAREIQFALKLVW